MNNGLSSGWVLPFRVFNSAFVGRFDSANTPYYNSQERHKRNILRLHGSHLAGAINNRHKIKQKKIIANLIGANIGPILYAIHIFCRYLFYPFYRFG